MARCVLIALLLLVQQGKAIYDGQPRIEPSGSNPYRGRLEVAHNFHWGTVCNWGFTHRSAHVACTEMNLDGGWRVGGYSHWGVCHNVDGRYMCGRHHIWLSMVWCHGWEQRLKDCYHWPWGWHWCSHARDVIVHCIAPPLWNIEWGFQDEPDINPMANGVVAHYALFFKRTITPNMFIKCWPMWKANEKLKVLTYTDDYREAETPNHISNAQIQPSWIPGWMRQPWPRPYVVLDARYQHCDMEKVRAVDCDGYSVPVDVLRSYCWESTPSMPEGYTLIQTHSNTTVIPTLEVSGGVNATARATETKPTTNDNQIKTFVAETKTVVDTMIKAAARDPQLFWSTGSLF